MTPPAPPRFSITTVCPRFSDNAGTTLRVTMSVPPPGAAGTTRRIGLVGYCASAGTARSQTRARGMNLVTACLPGDDVAGAPADVVEVELPHAVFLLGSALDQRAARPESLRPREHAAFGRALDDDLEPDPFDLALGHARVVEARDPPLPDLRRLLHAARAFLPHFLEHARERRLVVAGQDDLVSGFVNVDLVQDRSGHGARSVVSGAREQRLHRRRPQVLDELAGEIGVGRLGHDAGGIGRVGLDLLRERADELQPLALERPDLGNRREADLQALAAEDVLEDLRRARVAHDLRREPVADTEQLEQLLEIVAGPGLGVDDGVGAEQRLLEPLEVGDVGIEAAGAHRDTDSDPAEKDVLVRLDLVAPQLVVHQPGGRDEDVHRLARADAAFR